MLEEMAHLRGRFRRKPVVALVVACIHVLELYKF